MKYYLFRGDKFYGPYSEGLLLEFYNEGRLSSWDRVNHPESQQWISIDEFVEIRKTRSSGLALNNLPVEFIEALPMPISTKFSEYLYEEDPKMALYVARELLEVTLKTMVAIGLSEFDSLNKEFQLGLRERQFHRPTFGNWINILRFVISHQSKDSSFLEIASTFESLDDFFGKPGDPIEEGFLSMRNLRLARGGNFPRKEALRLFMIWEPRIKELIEQRLNWTKSLKLVGFDATGNGYLLKGQKSVLINEKMHHQELAFYNKVGVIRGTKFLPLSPLVIFDDEKKLPMLYMRKEENSLLYVRFSSEGGLYKADQEEKTTFIRHFEFVLGRSNDSEFVIKSFEPWIRKESERRVGRENLINYLVDKVKSPKCDRFCLISGPAGIGKSNLLCSLAEKFLNEPADDQLLLPYIFKHGDGRCSRQKFLRFIEERLLDSNLVFDQAKPSFDQGIPKNTEGSEMKFKNKIDFIKYTFESLNHRARILIIIDGLDEIIQSDEKFYDEIFSALICDKVTLVVGTRPVYGIIEKMKKSGAREVFPQGFPSMTQDDIRDFFMEKAEGFQKSFISCEIEKNGIVTNSFFEKVAARSNGLPIYLNYLLSDLYEGRITPDKKRELPLGIQEYHGCLLERHTISDYHALATPTIVLLALAHEPLTLSEIATFLYRSGKINSENTELVKQITSSISSMLRNALDPGGEMGFTIYHHSLRQHIEEDPGLTETVTNIRLYLSEFSFDPKQDNLEEYFFRCGIRHLLETQDFKKASDKMTDFQYMIRKFSCLSEPKKASDNWYGDWQRMQRASSLLESNKNLGALYDRKNTNIPFETRHFDHSGELHRWWDFAKSIKLNFEEENNSTVEIFLNRAIKYEEFKPISESAKAYTEKSQEN